MTGLDDALALADRGWHVFPVDHPGLPVCAGPHTNGSAAICASRGKEPASVNFTMAATTNPKMITTWFAGTLRNVGIYCGKSGLIVVDEDAPGALDRYAAEHGVTIPSTFTVGTAKGQHRYFAAPAGVELTNYSGALKAYGCDVRAGNGYVVGPGSVHASGTVYTVTDDREPAVMPGWLLHAVRKPQAVASASPADGPEWVRVEAATGGLAAVPDVIAAGTRHDVIMRFAASLRARDCPYAEAEILVETVWRRCEQPTGTPYALAEARGTLADVYARYPAGRSEPYALATANEAERDASAELEAREVAAEYRKLRVREAARARLAAEKAGPVPDFDLDTLGGVLARPAPPEARVDGLIPWEANTLISAQRKTGKTTTVLNLARSLLTGADFLGRFRVRRVAGNVAMLNFEVSAAQLARWAADAGIPAERLILVNLRGRRNPLGNPEDRQRLASRLRGFAVETIMVDPFGRAFTGTSQNDAGEVGAFLAELDRFARGDVGALDLVLCTHTGWDGERARGSTALEDWPDSIITLTRDNRDDGDGERYLRAIGRDVEVEEDRLSFDPGSRTLTLAGAGSRKTGRDRKRGGELTAAILHILADKPDANGAMVERELREVGVIFQKGQERKALRALVDTGRVSATDGPRNSTLYRIIAQPPQPPQASPRGGWGPTPPPFIGGGSTGATQIDSDAGEGDDWLAELLGRPKAIGETDGVAS